MKVLVATFRYLSLTGTETFTYTLLKTLKEQGLKVSFYSPFLAGPIFKETQKLGLEKISDQIEAFKNDRFDLIHCQHNPTAILLRFHFPKTPLVYLTHGPLPFLEQLPTFIKFNYYGAVSEEIRRNLKKQNLPSGKIFLLPNSIDTQRFRPLKPLPRRPKKILILSNYLNLEGEKVIKKAAYRLKLKTIFIGKNKAVFNIEKYHQQADIVLSLGRGIIEALSCGRAALVFGLDNNFYHAGDGMVTQENINRLAVRNFSGRTKKIPFTLENMIKEIKKYSPLMGKFNREYALKHFDINKNVKILLEIYEKAAQERAKSFDQERVGFEGQLLAETLAFEKLAFYHKDFKSLLAQRFKDQLIRR